MGTIKGRAHGRVRCAVPRCHASVASGIQLVSWCFEPSQPKRITSGLNTNLTLSAGYSFHKSSYHKSCVYFFFSLFIFRGHSTREPASSRLTYFILRAYTGVSQSQHWKKIGRGFGKNAREWAGRVEISKEEIPGSERSTVYNSMRYTVG